MPSPPMPAHTQGTPVGPWEGQLCEGALIIGGVVLWRSLLAEVGKSMPSGAFPSLWFLSAKLAAQALASYRTEK